MKAERPDLLQDITDAFNSPFNNERWKRLKKYHRIEKLVNIWVVFKQVDLLNVSEEATRSSPLRSSISLLRRYNGLMVEAVQEGTNRSKVWKSATMPEGEADCIFWRAAVQLSI